MSITVGEVVGVLVVGGVAVVEVRLQVVELRGEERGLGGARQPPHGRRAAPPRRAAHVPQLLVDVHRRLRATTGGTHRRSTLF